MTPLWYRNPDSMYARHVVAYSLGLPVNASNELMRGRLSRFQEENSLPVTGRVDDRTAESIGEMEIPWLIKELMPELTVSPEIVRRLQSERGERPTGFPSRALRVDMVMMGY